jgi:uncharacterized alkaline shock family protein YloU
MEGHAVISSDIVASYAADAARDVEGVVALVDGHLPRRGGVRVTDDEGRVRIELRLRVAWGSSFPDVGRAVQRKVREYLLRMADVQPETVDVVVDEVEPPPR